MHTPDSTAAATRSQKTACHPAATAKAAAGHAPTAAPTCATPFTKPPATSRLRGGASSRESNPTSMCHAKAPAPTTPNTPLTAAAGRVSSPAGGEPAPNTQGMPARPAARMAAASTITGARRPANHVSEARPAAQLPRNPPVSTAANAAAASAAPSLPPLHTGKATSIHVLRTERTNEMQKYPPASSHCCGSARGLLVPAAVVSLDAEPADPELGTGA